MTMSRITFPPHAVTSSLLPKHASQCAAPLPTRIPMRPPPFRLATRCESALPIQATGCTLLSQKPHFSLKNPIHAARCHQHKLNVFAQQPVYRRIGKLIPYFSSPILLPHFPLLPPPHFTAYTPPGGPR